MPLLNFKLWSDGACEWWKYDVEYHYDNGIKIDSISNDGFEYDLDRSEIHESIMDRIYEACENDYKTNYMNKIKFPCYYQYGNTYYMIKNLDSYVKVTCYEVTDGYGITTEVMIAPKTIIENGTEINFNDFEHKYRRAKNRIEAERISAFLKCTPETKWY